MPRLYVVDVLYKEIQFCCVPCQFMYANSKKKLILDWKYVNLKNLKWDLHYGVGRFLSIGLAQIPYQVLWKEKVCSTP